MGSDSEGVRLWALLMALYPLLIWILYVVSDRRAEYFQSLFVIDAAVVAVAICGFAVPFMSALSALSAVILSSSLCLSKQTLQSRCVKLLLVLVVASQARYFFDGFKMLGFEQSLALMLLMGFSWGAATLVNRESAARSGVYRATKAAQDRVVQQVDSIRPYLPIASLIDAPPEPGARRRVLTLFIADLVDSTGTADLHCDDLFTELLNDYIVTMGQLVLKYGGTLDKFTGDGLVVVFGLDDCDPEFAAKRCADMALAMRPALGSLLWRWRSRLSRLPTGQRIGIHSGECLVGSFGCPERLNYTVLGRAVHIAARLEQLALPDEILVSAETAELLDEGYNLEDRLPANVSGLQSKLCHSALLD